MALLLLVVVALAAGLTLGHNVGRLEELPGLLLMVPAAMTASCAFMLPVATGPNAVVFSSERILIREMAREGLVLNLTGVIVVTSVCYFLFR